jgi:uncharacterized protein DUF1493
MAGRPTFDEVANLLAELRAEPRENITPDTRLREDLGIDGDDWDEVLIAIKDRWRMDWKGFDFYAFFSEEPSWRSLMFAVRDLLAGRRLKSLTVGHLLLVLQHGKWVEPPGQAA